ncbi:MAG: HIT domain-containing protein [Chloroflexi bacterium]|nr:HIT domain-containing protein [Chloroflexota bacterium]
MEDCIFCKIVAGKIKSWVAFENDHVLAFFDVNPVCKYHTVIIPKTHHINIFDIPDQDLEAMTKATKHLAVLYKEKLGIANIQLVSSSGVEAQQDVFHFHFHLIPRHEGDGQNLVWETHPEWVKEFDRFLMNVKQTH